MVLTHSCAFWWLTACFRWRRWTLSRWATRPRWWWRSPSRWHSSKAPTWSTLLIEAPTLKWTNGWKLFLRTLKRYIFFVIRCVFVIVGDIDICFVQRGKGHTGCLCVKSLHSCYRGCHQHLESRSCSSRRSGDNQYCHGPHCGVRQQKRLNWRCHWHPWPVQIIDVYHVDPISHTQ